MARSINSPGVQIVETDLSNFQQLQGGTIVYTAGFAPQGPTDEPLLITSISEFEQIYGTPETAAERYFYHTSKQILNSPATLLTTRLPYGSGAGEGFADQYSALIFPVLSSINEFKVLEPVYKTLTEGEYENFIQGNITWNTITETSSSASLTDNAIEGGLVIINSSKTAVNEQFEGYYVTLTDNSEFGPDTDFTAVRHFYSLSAASSFVDVPAGRLGFALSGTKDTAGSNSLSETIEGVVDYALNQDYYKDVLVLNVFRVRNSIYEPQTLTYSLIETHLGSLDANKKELAAVGGTRRSFYLENTVNNASNNIKVYVNPNISKKTAWISLTANEPAYAVRNDAATRAAYPNSVYLPSFNNETNKDVGSVIQKLERALTFVETSETTPLDIVVDGGLTTVYVNASANNGYYDESKFMSYTSLTSVTDDQITGYKSVFNVFNNFVSNIRKDCVFIADPLRQVFVNGENTKVYDLQKTTFTQNIYNPLKNLFSSINSNYSVTYGNWVKSYDAFSDKQVWLPFSGYAAGIYARTDAFTQPWIAPAGLTRGTIPNVVDLAFNPNQKQRDFLYTISINPVVFFANDGYVVFGQKTLQNKPSSFDRVNVRRLFLTLERATQSALKYYVFEPNTEFTRTRLKNAIVPIFELAKNTEGLYDYLIVCDERNNTADVIDRNELVVDIYIKPVKAAEFILVNFIATRTGQNFQELL